ncbi:MAG: prephenate dehydratase [Candidatus Bathyarchaeia archaeon]
MNPTPLKVGYLGPEGTFCEQAAKRYFAGKDVNLIGLDTIPEVFRAVESRSLDLGVVPAENSYEGSVNLTLDLLYRNNVKMCGEIEEPIVHHLIVKPGTGLEEIKIILSHPQALAQCRNLIAQRFPTAKIREVESTAAAVMKLKSLKRAAAIGSEASARAYGMQIALREVGDVPKNITRFIVIGTADSPPTGNDKTSVIFATENIPGALYHALAPFAERRINLTKIESRPMKGKEWEYIFYMDFEGHRTEEKILGALEELRGICCFLKVLGSYPKARKTTNNS